MWIYNVKFKDYSKCILAQFLLLLYRNEMFNAGCLILTFCNCQEGTLQWGWSTECCYFCGGEGRHTWRLDFVSPVHCLCSHQEWSFHSGMPMPISGNWRKGVWLWQNWILFSSEISVVSFPHPQKSSTDNSFIFFFFCIPYNDSTMFFETNIAALGSEPRQNLPSKPWLHLHTLLMSWHGQLFLCDRGPLCSHWHHWLLWTPIAPMLVHGGSHINIVWCLDRNK